VTPFAKLKGYKDTLKTIQKLAAEISVFNSADLLASIAALQIIPENIERAFRLQVLAEVIGSIPHDGRKRIVSPHNLRQICNTPPIGRSWISSMEDPFENCFTDAFTFFGGNYVVLPGVGEEGIFAFKHICNAIFKNANGRLDQEFVKSAYGLILATLLISNRICEKANLHRGIEYVAHKNKDVIIPDVSKLAHLKNAVLFNKKEIEDLLRRKGIEPQVIKRLCVDIGQLCVPANVNPFDGEILRKPIVEVEDNIIVALPGDILNATVYSIIDLAVEHSVIDKLAQEYLMSNWNTLQKSLDFLGCEQLKITPPPLPEDIISFRDGYFYLDSDKIIYAMLITDDFNDWSCSKTITPWPMHPNLNDKIYRRIKEIEMQVFSEYNGVNDILVLLTIQGIGRYYTIGFGNENLSDSSRFLNQSLAALETIALLEGGRPLILWKFAKASDELRKSTEIIAFNTLDEFGLYRGNGYSYYLGDDAKPGLLSISPDHGGKLRREARRKRDWHGTVSYDPGYIVEVTRLHDIGDIPIYVNLNSLDHEVAVLLEGLPFPVWIVKLVFENSEQRKQRVLYFEFADTIAYWLWQFTPSLANVFCRLKVPPERLLVELYIEPNESWHFQTTKKDLSVPPICIKIEKNTKMIRLILNASFTELICRADNTGERKLMNELLIGFRELFIDEIESELSNENIERMIDRHAPLGIKKKFALLNSVTSLEFDINGLPRFRPVHDADTDELLDELGNYLVNKKNYDIGEILSDNRVEVLNTTVTYFYEKLQSMISTLNPNGLLEWLIAHYEAVRSYSAQSEFSIPTRLACYGTEKEMIEELKEEIPHQAEVANALRFVIEYVAARPTKGYRVMSYSIYDRILAIASRIINFGMDSDLCNYKIADIRYAVLPSQRLGADRTHQTKVRDTHFQYFAMNKIESENKSFAKHWREPVEPKEKPKNVEKIDKAALEEFGFTITNFIELMAEGINIGREIDRGGFACLEYSDFVNRLMISLKWDFQSVTDCLRILTLSERPDFLKPEEPYRREEVYPWRYNRALTYLRRPFIRRTYGNKDQILWGIRGVFSAHNYLISLCMDGRLRANNKQMKEVMGEINSEKGKIFEDEVAYWFEFESNTELIIRKRVSKIGHLKELKNLGDIDILSVDRQKRQIGVIDCKDILFATMPHQLHLQLVELFHGTSKEKSIVEKHSHRTEWVKKHVKEILSWMSIEPSGNWKVIPLIVLSQELLAPYLWPASIPVISFAKLKREFKTHSRGLIGFTKK